MAIDPEISFEQISALDDSGVQSILNELTASELESVAVAVIQEHRSRVQLAEDLFNELSRIEAANEPEQYLEPVKQSYWLALLNLHAQHELVSRVIKQLGYVPMVDEQRPVWN